MGDGAWYDFNIVVGSWQLFSDWRELSIRKGTWNYGDELEMFRFWRFGPFELRNFEAREQ